MRRAAVSGRGAEGARALRDLASCGTPVVSDDDLEPRELPKLYRVEYRVEYRSIWRAGIPDFPGDFLYRAGIVNTGPVRNTGLV